MKKFNCVLSMVLFGMIAAFSFGAMYVFGFSLISLFYSVPGIIGFIGFGIKAYTLHCHITGKQPPRFLT